MMNKNLKKIMWFFLLLILPVAFYAQKDITQFLDIPVDGYKPEMIQKLKSRGYTINRDVEDILEGEFNGQDVNLFIGTNNNKVWRIIVADKNSTDETNIKIRFNNLIQQFVNNNRYSTPSDSLLSKFIIPQDEDIAYEMKVKNKRYEAAFYQKAVEYDSLTFELDKLQPIDKENDKELEKLTNLIAERVVVQLDALNKLVWFMIKEDYGEYSITIFYENLYNKANGEGL